MTQDQTKRVEFHEKVLCVIFNRQFVGGGKKCLALRQALMNLWEEAYEAGAQTREQGR